jgi:3-oxoacyl-[acyl-carrier-protein] synthase II
VALRALAERVVPATVGFDQPAPEAIGLVDTRPRPLAEGPLLLTNSGFGGINAALLLERGAA